MLPQPLTIAVTSRALFDLEDEHAVFEDAGTDAYVALQSERADAPLDPGPAFGLVDGLSRLNRGDLLNPPVNVIVVSRNAPGSGLRFLDAVRAHGIGARRAMMTGGRPVTPYLSSIRADLFLTRSDTDGQEAARAGIPTGILAAGCPHVPFDGEIRVALDGDAVVFDDASEVAFERGGYDGWCRYEEENAHLPLARGPLTGFVEKLSAMRGLADSAGIGLRIALVTSRDGDARARALRTLSGWGVAVDEAYFLGDVSKGDALRAFRPHLFLDDRHHHVASVAPIAPAGLVPRPTPSQSVGGFVPPRTA